jgi:hypothetical protein
MNVRILHATPHLPPDQAANALLPFHLGTWAAAAGDEVEYLAHPPRQRTSSSGRRQVSLPGPVTWVGSHHARGRIARTLRLAAATTAGTIARAAWPAVRRADVVHVHSNGLLAEVVALVA